MSGIIAGIVTAAIGIGVIVFMVVRSESKATTQESFSVDPKTVPDQKK